MNKIKLPVLFSLKIFGLFYLSRYLMRKRPLILAYHGFELVDEASFRPKLFMKQQTFAKRMKYINRYFNVIGIDDLADGLYKKNSIVITIDDGWYSTKELAHPILAYYGFKYVVYSTTLDSMGLQPIFHIALDYVLRKSLGKKLHLDLDYRSYSALIEENCIPEIITELSKFKKCRNDTELLRKVSAQLGFNDEVMLSSRMFELMYPEEISSLYNEGAQIELHTHTHNTPLNDDESFCEEINSNRDNLQSIIGVLPTHHCYPSGSYNSRSIELLRKLGIKTATTCNPGFVDVSSELLELPRFLDGENIHQLVFEAELSGVLEHFRRLKRILKSSSNYIKLKLK